MKYRKYLALVGTVALLVVIFTEPAARMALWDGLIGCAEATQRVYDYRCSFLNHPHIPLWQRFDPTCPQCL